VRHVSLAVAVEALQAQLQLHVFVEAWGAAP